MRAGVDINGVDNVDRWDTGRPPGTVSQVAATKHGQMEAIHLLLDFGVDPERAMYVRIHSKRPYLVKGLMEQHPGMIEKDREGRLVALPMGPLLCR
jgi:hypothetical protein